MKKSFLGILLIICLTLMSCQKKPTEVEVPTTSETTSEEMTESETASETATEDEEETTSSEGTTEEVTKGAIYEIEGTVVDAAMHSILIETEDGEMLNLSMEDYEIISRDGLAIDDKVKITYQDGHVIKIVEIQE